jgi:hypothetical protein
MAAEKHGGRLLQTISGGHLTLTVLLLLSVATQRPSAAYALPNSMLQVISLALLHAASVKVVSFFLAESNVLSVGNGSRHACMQ